MTTLVLVRHGVTAHTSARRFSGGLSGDDPPLSEEGHAQARATARWLADTGALTAIVGSPVRRTRQTAAALAEATGLAVDEEPGVAETDFGAWDGLSMAEVSERWGTAFADWRDDPDLTPPGGESLTAVRARVLLALGRIVEAHPDGTVAVVSHVTPIKVLVAHALGVPLATLFRMELSPASVSVVGLGEQRDGLRLFNARPPGVDPVRPASTTW